MKKTFALITLLTIAIYANGQQRSDYIGISIGGATPVGAFAATNDQYVKAGFATSGASFNINYMHRLSDLFSLCITSFDAANNVNENKMLAASGAYSLRVNKASAASCLLIGGMIKKRDFPIYGKAMIGFGSAQSADITFNDQAGIIQYQQGDPAFGFAYSVGAGALFSLSSRWALNVSIDYVSCLGKSTVTFIENGTNYGSSPTFSYGQNFICTQVGIGYMFGPRSDRSRKPKTSKRF